MLKGAKGNNRAIREIWDTWTPRIDLFFRKSVPERDRDDLIQDTMLKIYRNLDQYNPMFAPSTWIYSIAQRVKIDYLRSQSNSARYLYANDDILEHVPSRDGSPGETLIFNEQIRQVEACLDRLDERDRAIVFLHFYEGMSGRSVARAMGLPPETVRYRLKLLKRRLKEELDQ